MTVSEMEVVKGAFRALLEGRQKETDVHHVSAFVYGGPPPAGGLLSRMLDAIRGEHSREVIPAYADSAPTDPPEGSGNLTPLVPEEPAHEK